MRARRRVRVPGTTLRARSGMLPSLYLGPLEMPPPGHRARLHLIFYKVSQNGQVSPKYLEKACHSPYSQKRVQNSPLGILRFPYLLAFSHKELMGLFSRTGMFMVKMTKCRPYVHHCSHAKGSSDTPRVPQTSCFWDPSSSDSARDLLTVFSTTSF